MTFRRLILVMGLAMIILVMGLLGFSYAWYGFNHINTAFNVNTSQENPTVNVIFAQTSQVNITVGVPISSSDVATKAGKSNFTVYADPTELSGYSVSLQISLIDIVIDDVLKVSDFKYQLLEDSSVIASGTGATIGSNTEVTLKSAATISLGTTYSYELRIWLEDSGVSQNTLMGKTFSAEVLVTSGVKK